METQGKEIVLGTAYWPNLHYFSYLLNADSCVIDVFEHYEKQSYRNRCKILSANGVLDLSIPVEHPGKGCAVKGIKISAGKWRSQHASAIQSAYGKSPYFAYFGEEVLSFYEKEYESLLAFNTAQLQFLLKVFRLQKNISQSQAYVEVADGMDLRQLIHPKKSFMDDSLVAGQLRRSYYQVFGDKFGFSANLSILDLLFNKGLDSLGYLRMYSTPSGQVGF